MEAIRNLYGATSRIRPVVYAASNRHFAYGLNFYKLFWLFAFGSAIGFLVETIWCVIKTGQIEARASMIYGPFNVVYGIGALVLYLCLRKIDKKKWYIIFSAGIAAGTMVEFICSYIQEVVFGTISWDYSHLPLNIGGRVCLLYSVFWGVLALLWVYAIYPLLKKLMLKIPDSTGRGLAWVLLAFLVIDSAISIAAVSRWVMRADGIPATGQVTALLDQLYPDAKMASFYPNMKLC